MSGGIYDLLVAGNQKYGTSIRDIAVSEFHCDPDEIARTVIMAPCWEAEMFSGCADVVSCAPGARVLRWNVGEFTYIRTGIGAPNVTDITLALGGTPCRRIVFIGAAGSLSEEIGIGDISVPSSSISGDGAERYLSAELGDCFGKTVYPDRELASALLESAGKRALPFDRKLHSAVNFSVDTLFAQFAHIDKILSLGSRTIDMEASACLRASELCGIKAAAVFSISDNTVVGKSLYSGRSETDAECRRATRALIPEIVMEALTSA